ncbi:hypothetical protein KSP40_PGU010101 [Platanthera guangdongensis]|uniref:Uncharacterized protein n=1 Tax=Platanthera guangdongensis TaxID=2320717 RepID=A0ABR2M557_9ASPA
MGKAVQTISFVLTARSLCTRCQFGFVLLPNENELMPTRKCTLVICHDDLFDFIAAKLAVFVSAEGEDFQLPAGRQRGLSTGTTTNTISSILNNNVVLDVDDDNNYICITISSVCSTNTAFSDFGMLSIIIHSHNTILCADISLNPINTVPNTRSNSTL